MFSRFAEQLRQPRAYLALLLGASFAVLAYSYLLVDILPPTSKSILLCTALAGLAGIVGYYLLLDPSLVPPPSRLEVSTRWGFIAGSVLIGIYLAFAYLDGAGSTSRYINFLLPRQTLMITVPVESDGSEAPVIISRFSTSLGDVSYDSLRARGWKRDGSDFVLTNLPDNRLQWTGRTGEEAIVTFRTSNRPRLVEVRWNGHAQVVNIPTGGDGRYQAAFRFSVPLYASEASLHLLGAFTFILLSYAATGLIWRSRIQISEHLEQSLASLLHSRALEPEGHTAASALELVRRADWAIMAGLVMLALLLRVFNLDVLYPYADEYAHLLAAKSLLQGAPLTSVFDRSLFTVTIPIVIMQRLFGVDLWTARLPGVIFNALGIVPLYLLAKKINRPVAILSCLLYATSPWIIAVARNVREYAYYPFYFYWIAYAFVLLLERLPNRLVLFKDWRVLLRSGLRWPSLVLFLAPVYAVFLDARSTFKIIVIAYGVFGLFLLRKLDLKSRLNLGSLALLATGILAGGISYAGLGHLSVPLSPHFNAAVLEYFLPSPPQQWYFDRPALVVGIVLTVAGVLSVRALRVNFVPSFLALLFLASLVFFVIFFGHYLKPRYLMIVQFWYVILFAFGLYGVSVLILRLPRREITFPVLTLALFVCTFNFPQSVMPTFYSKQGNMPITEEYHFNLGPAYEYLLHRVKSQDVLVSSFYAGYVRWKGVPEFADVIPYQFIVPSLKYRWIFPYEAVEILSITPHEFILAAVREHDTGWVVLDSVTYSATLSKPLALKTTVEGDKRIDYLGYYGGEYIWRWQPTQPVP